MAKASQCLSAPEMIGYLGSLGLHLERDEVIEDAISELTY